MTEITSTSALTDSRSSDVGHTASVDYEKVSGDYLGKRQLKKGVAGWVLLAGLGVSYVISGDFADYRLGVGALL